MKCNSYVKWATRRRKGSGAEYQKAIDIRSRLHFPDEKKMLADGYVLCDGHVTCTKVEAQDEPYMGGCSAVLEVEYACDKCGSTFFPELGGTDGVKQLAQRAVDAIDDAYQQRLRDEWWRLYTMRIEERVRLHREGKLSATSLLSPSQETEAAP